MVVYPTIPNKPPGRATKFWIFDKIDGSNIRVSWSKKKGFYKFGSRKQLLSSEAGILQKAIVLAKNVENDFNRILSKKLRLEQVVCFFEFHGPKSFAGSHDINDSHSLTLIDIHVHKRGFLPPGDFIKFFYNSSFNVPNFLGKHIVDGAYRKAIIDGRLPGMSFEGVVCKANPERATGAVNMFKVKNKAWVEKVKSVYKLQPHLIEKLL